MKSINDASRDAIGVFDSGIGGLTVVREILSVLPGEDIVYLGDTARVPYGIRSPETVIRYSLECSRFLLSRVKLLVIACNTVSAVALDEIKELAQTVPVIGVIGPGARAASSATKNSKIGVIGTEATIKSGAYQRAIGAAGGRRGQWEVIAKACPLFVPLVEEGWLEGPVPELVASSYLSEMKSAGIDTLVLGCTHYPLLKPVIAKTMGGEVALIDSATETALVVKAELENKGMCKKDGGVLKVYVTDDPARFKAVGERFLEREITDIEKVSFE